MLSRESNSPWFTRPPCKAQLRASDRQGGHGLDPISVGIDDKGRKVVRAVGGAQTGRTIVLPSVRQRLGVEARNRLTRRRGEGEMEPRARRYRIARLELDGE